MRDPRVTEVRANERTSPIGEKDLETVLTRRTLLAGTAAATLATKTPSLALPQTSRGLNLRGVLPMDAVPGSGWTCCYGVAALTRKWQSGPLFDVIGPDGTTHTIYAQNGYPDVKRLAAVMGIDEGAGIKGLLCPRIYDQSGNGRDATQAEMAKQPAIWLIDGNVYIFFGGILSTDAQKRLSPQFFEVPTTAKFNSQSFSAFCIFKPYTSSVGVSSANKFSTLFSASGTTPFLIAFPSTLGRVNPAGFLIDLKTFTAAKISTPNIGIQESVISAVGTAGSSSFAVNDRYKVARPITPSTIAGGTIGCDQTASGSFPNGASGRMKAFLFTSSPFSEPQQRLFRNALYQYAGIQTALTTNVVVDGASYDQGQGGDASGLYEIQNGGGYGWAEMIQDKLSDRPIQWNNVAGSGNTIANCKSNYPTITAHCFNPAASRNILIGPNSAFGNSLNPENENRTGAEAYGDFALWLTAARTSAWNNILCLLFPTTDPQAVIYNNLMRQNAEGNGIALIDIASDTGLLNPPYMNSDGHPTIIGYKAMADSVVSRLRSVL